MSNFVVPASIFNVLWDGVAAELFEALTEMVFYGILLVLVAFAANLLLRRQAAGSFLLAGATGVMFLLATLQLAFRLAAAGEAAQMLYLRVAGRVAPQDALAADAQAKNLYFNFVEDVLLVTNNLFTDGILIYRCFLIWGRNYYVAAAPSIMLLLTTILSYLSAVEGDYPRAGGPTVDLRIGFLLGVLTNIVLVGLTAGRIFYTRRRANTMGIQAEIVKRYNNATAMILESGALICGWTLVYIALRSVNVPPTVWRVFRGGLAQLLNIAPTLIVVRVGLGHESGDQTRVGSTWRSKDSSVASKV